MRQGLILDTRVLKILKATAALEDVSVSELLERIVVCALEGSVAFSEEELKAINKFRSIYGLTRKAADVDKIGRPENKSERPRD